MVTNCINDTYKYFSISLCDINLAKYFYINSKIVAGIQYPRCVLYVFFIISCAISEKPGAFQQLHKKFHRYKEIPSIGTLIPLWFQLSTD